MLLELRIKVTSPFLGRQFRAGDQLRTFRRIEGGQIAIELPQYHWAMRMALDNLKLPVDLDQIRFPIGFDAQVDLYSRKFTKRDGTKGKDMFEAVMDGREIVYDIMLLTEDEQGKQAKPITLADLTKVFELCGKMVGWSPWGGQYAYGRFQVTSLLEKA